MLVLNLVMTLIRDMLIFNKNQKRIKITNNYKENN